MRLEEGRKPFLGRRADEMRSLGGISVTSVVGQSGDPAGSGGQSREGRNKEDLVFT